jgi:hypothetical protein
LGLSSTYNYALLENEMTVKLLVAEGVDHVSVEGTSYTPKNGTVEVADHHAVHLRKWHGMKTPAEQAAAQAAADKLRREQQAELQRMENEDRAARIQEAKALLEGAGMKVTGARA